MTAYRFVTLTCDSCGEIWDDGMSKRFGEARSSARQAGWVRMGTTGDLCGVCNGTHEQIGGGLGIRRKPAPDPEETS